MAGDGYTAVCYNAKMLCGFSSQSYPCLMINPELLWELFTRTARGAPMIVSSNWAAYLISGIIFLFNSVWHFFDLRFPWRERLREVWKSKKKDIFRSSVILAIFWTILFSASFVTVLNEDRTSLNSWRGDNQQLKGKARDLQRQLDDNCKEDKRSLQQAEQEAQAERDDARHWREAYEGISRGDLHPDRHLDSEDQRRLREQLRIIAKDPRNKDYVKLDFGIVPRSKLHIWAGNSTRYFGMFTGIYRSLALTFLKSYKQKSKLTAVPIMHKAS